MKYLVVLCCLLFAVRALADNVYFDGYVTIKGGGEEENAKVQYVFKDDRDAFFELTIIPDGEDEDPIVFSGLMKKTESEKFTIYSADGKQRIGAGTAKGGDAFTLDFSLLYKGIKVGDVKIDKKFDDDGDVPGVYLNFKLIGVLVDLSFESNLPLDMAKTMRCSSWADDQAPDC